MDNNYDKMSYSCMWCHHIWKFVSNKTGTLVELNQWVESIKKEHYKICKMYRILRDHSKEEKNGKG